MRVHVHTILYYLHAILINILTLNKPRGKNSKTLVTEKKTVRKYLIVKLVHYPNRYLQNGLKTIMYFYVKAIL